MIECVVHCGDVHIMKDIRHEEYRGVFNIFYNKIKEIKPDRIVVNGDIWNDWVDIKSEGFILLGEFLNRLSFTSKVIITKGNHDFSRKNLNRIDTIKSITTLLNNKNITYYDKTGFYEDENVVWSVWDNADRGNPWKMYPIKKDKNKTYIDLYHDPILNAKLYNGTVYDKKNVPTIKELLGDLSMLNDIHLFQFFDNGTKAYSSSMIQQNYGETVQGHGFLKWSISNKSFEFIDLPNEYALIKFEINPGQDYDKIKLHSNHISKYNKFRVEWNDYAAYINNDNENKIRKYLKEKYNASDIEIKQNRIYTDIKDGKMLSEIISINDKEVQQNIIRQYLKENKFDNDIINKIIEIDNIINDRLQLSDSKNIIWNIDKFWFSNFKSYGDNCEISWDKISGIIQISGENQQGKTTILDAICFILYGTTLSTMKSEKNGNNRYINKYRNLNSCEGGCIIDINGEKYIMHRKVEREIKKGVIKSCPMTLDYFKGIEMIEENKETGENKVRTQKILDDVLGDFQDFIRMSLTNADNLNQLLSMDRSVFIDSIVKDAGYDIFEKKLDEFKEYKKELNLEKINLNEIDIEKQINNMSGDLKDKESYLSDIDLELIEIDQLINKESKIKDGYLIKLHKIDDKFLNLDIQEIKNTIYNNKQKIVANQFEIDNIEEQILLLPKDFDTNQFDLISEQYDKYIKEKNKRSLDIIEFKSTISQNNNRILNVDRDINNEKSNYLRDLENEIKSLQQELNELINNKSNELSNKKLLKNNLINLCKKEIENYRSEGLEIKKKISSYEDIRNGKKSVCPTCNQEIVNCDHQHIDQIILDCNSKLIELAKIGKSKLSQIDEIKTELEDLDENHKNFLMKIRKDYNEKIQKIQDKIDNFDITLIKEKVENIISNKEESIRENENISIKIDNNVKFLERLDVEIEKKKDTINSLKKEKILFEKYKDSLHKKDILLSTSKDIQKILDDNKRLLNDYEENIKLIKENEELNILINEKYLKLKELKNKKNNYSDDKLSYSNEITLIKKIIDDLVMKLKLYREQQQLEELHNTYIKLMHRTGLPTYLLMKNIDLLNSELSNLLTSTDFILFFDGDLNLKLQHNGKNGEINVIETSGYERTMCAIVLKIVLRIINFKSKPNFMFFDEILNKCYGKSVEKLVELLNTLKTKIDKIVIIEHNNEIQSDLIISVIKDEYGVSSFEII